MMRISGKNWITNMVLVVVAATFAACGGTWVADDTSSSVSSDTSSADAGNTVDVGNPSTDVAVAAPDIQVDIVPPLKCGEFDCNDGNICTVDYCDLAKGCTHTDNNVVCNDGNPSTSNDICLLGVCSGQLAAAPVVECESDNLIGSPLCEDFDACTIDACLSGKCVHKAQNCDDGVDCTTDICDKQLGCANKVDNTKCAAGTVCWQSGYQNKGGCFQCDPTWDGNQKECNDNNDCTADKCASGKCVSTLDKNAEGDYCDDGNACTEYWMSECKDAKCVATVNNPCDDGNTCTADSCDPKGGCVYSNLSGVCDDGVVCTIGDFCQGGECYSGTASCDDNNPCTTDYCSTYYGNCQHASSSGATCNDGNPCTVGDKCSSGTCAVGTSVNCDDNNACTTDYCQLGMCGHTAIANCGGTVPPPVSGMIKVTIGCSDAACEPHVFFGTGQDLYKTTLAANGTVDVFGTKAEFCMWGGEVATRVAKSLNPVMLWYGCDAGAPASKSVMIIEIDGVPVPKPYSYISKPNICLGAGEGNLVLPKSLFGCP